MFSISQQRVASLWMRHWLHSDMQGAAVVAKAGVREENVSGLPGAGLPPGGPPPGWPQFSFREVTGPMRPPEAVPGVPASLPTCFHGMARVRGVHAFWKVIPVPVREACPSNNTMWATLGGLGGGRWSWERVLQRALTSRELVSLLTPPTVGVFGPMHFPQTSLYN